MWARGGLGVDDEPIRALEAFGVPAHVIAEARAALQERPNHFAVLPENWHAVCAFVRMSDQWRVVMGMGGMHWLGLDFAALPVVLAATKQRVAEHLRRPLPDLLDQLRSMADAARRVLNG